MYNIGNKNKKHSKSDVTTLEIKNILNQTFNIGTKNKKTF